MSRPSTYADAVTESLISLILVVVAYVIGMFPSAQMVARRVGRDPTREGSGNPGASNVYRLAGKRAGVMVGLIDMLKGMVPVLAALLTMGRATALGVWVAAVAGHVWPIVRRFRGGKGVATAGGGGLVIDPVIGIVAALLFFLTARLSGVAALGSLAIAVSFPLLSIAAGRSSEQVAVSSGVALILIVRHQSNIRRLLKREENHLGSNPNGDRAA